MRHPTDYPSEALTAGGGLPVRGSAANGYTGHAWFARNDGKAVTVRKPGLPPALREAEFALAGQDRNISRRALRIPSADAVAVSSRATAPLRIAGPKPPVQANDNAAAAKSGPSRIRTMLRELLLLAVLAATLAAVYNLGRLNAAQNVISLPDPDRRGIAIG